MGRTSRRRRAERLRLREHARARGDERIGSPGDPGRKHRDVGGPGRADGPALEGRFDELGGDLLERVAAVWQRGWQPADLARIIRHDLGARAGRLAIDVIAAERACTVAVEVDPRWESQLDVLECTVWWSGRRSVVASWAEREGLDPAAALALAHQTSLLVSVLPVLPTLIPPPGSPIRPLSSHHGRRGVDSKLLARVQALLAKAESTEFPEEAEAFTTKAQELMARHAIDDAMLGGATGGIGGADGRRAGEPDARRFGIDDPYSRPKGRLLSEIASANRCRAVLTMSFGFGTVFGWPVDLDHVEMLYASLLVQSSVALNGASAGAQAGARARSRGFRQSFLLGFAARIGERLREASEEATRAAAIDHGSGMLPVLAGRGEAVEELRAAVFPTTRTMGAATINDGAGWYAGRDAADRASLGEPPRRLAPAAGE
jgi:Protein of unknown function (DUF2786)